MTRRPLRPVAIRAPHGARVFEITWPQQSQHRLSHQILRGYCPCAGCQGHSGLIRLQEIHSELSLELREIQEVGQYALGLVWGDGHRTGIYSFAYLHRLGQLVEAHGEEAVLALQELPRVQTEESTAAGSTEG